MNQRVKSLGLLMVIVAMLVSPALGKGPAGVALGLHNMSQSRPNNVNGIFVGTQYESSNVDEVCVFCHTPHGGVLDGPLWNHSMPAASSFTHYNSASLSPYLQSLDASRDISKESLICMACHDGSVAVNSLHNNPNAIAPDPVYLNGTNPSVPIVGGLFGTPNARIGATRTNVADSGDLTDDHPISFSYDQVFSPLYDTGGNKEGELNTVALALAADIRFFGTDNRVECSSCHDPHVNYNASAGGDKNYAPFLIRSNAGSGLCLACHNK